jgi:hypothetical protein
MNPVLPAWHKLPNAALMTTLIKRLPDWDTDSMPARRLAHPLILNYVFEQAFETVNNSSIAAEVPADFITAVRNATHTSDMKGVLIPSVLAWGLMAWPLVAGYITMSDEELVALRTVAVGTSTAHMVMCAQLYKEICRD